MIRGHVRFFHIKAYGSSLLPSPFTGLPGAKECHFSGLLIRAGLAADGCILNLNRVLAHSLFVGSSPPGLPDGNTARLRMIPLEGSAAHAVRTGLLWG